MNFDQRRGGLAQNRNQTEGQRQGLRDKMRPSQFGQGFFGDSLKPAAIAVHRRTI
jgi:hypothetical protein